MVSLQFLCSFAIQFSPIKLYFLQEMPKISCSTLDFKHRFSDFLNVFGKFRKIGLCYACQKYNIVYFVLQVQKNKQAASLLKKRQLAIFTVYFTSTKIYLRLSFLSKFSNISSSDFSSFSFSVNAKLIVLSFLNFG